MLCIATIWGKSRDQVMLQNEMAATVLILCKLTKYDTANDGLLTPSFGYTFAHQFQFAK